MKERSGLVILAALLLTACNEQNNSNSNNSANASYNGRSFSVIGKLRPRADANMVNEIHTEEEAAARAKQAEFERQLQAQRQANEANNPMRRNLSGVKNTSFGGNLPSVYSQIPGLSPAQQKQIAELNGQAKALEAQGQSSWTGGGGNTSTPPPPPAAGYNVNYTTPSTGFVPPPPAVSLTTTAVPMPPYGQPPPGYNPYANPYGYGAPPEPAQPTRSASSGFGALTSGAKAAAASGDSDEPRKKKEKPMQLITPTGMDARSPYKQRDELRLLWKGALATTLSNLSGDPKLSEGMTRVDVGLPGESTRGSLSIAQRQIDNIFKNNSAVDRKIIAPVKKTQADLVQAYYHYLYAYNKFFLTQQQVQARKQELECAETQAEKQRATVDLANAQQEADSSKEDMRASQGDLASVAGASAARAVIKNVSGVTPTLEQVAPAETAQAQNKEGGGLTGIFNVFGFGKGKAKENAAPADEAPKVAAAAAEETGKDKKKKEDKEVKEKKKGKKGDKEAKDKEVKDKEHIAARPPSEAAPAHKAAAEDSTPSAPSAAASSGPVSFELKDVKTTPRKSILRVVVRNGGGDSFSFDADSISVAEGNNRLAEAAVNAEFDSTIVQPSGEVTGTITIFGRPWNDKLSVSLSSGSKSILLHR